MKKLVAALILSGSLSSLPVFSQTVFSYGNNTVSKNEFVQAFNKNNNGEKAGEKAYRDYLELYTRFKLKVRAGLDQKIDTLPNQKAELQNFRSQIIGGFMNDETAMKQLEDEALQRSHKDIHLAHIYIPFAATDTGRAAQLAQEAYSQLQKGADFGNIATKYSDDPSAQMNKGDIGYITVFTLPYELETLAYTTAPGSFSKPYRSKLGYHIFKNLGERKAFGNLKAAQIFLAFPPGSSDTQKENVKRLADSIYTAADGGASFAQLATHYSSDNLTYQNGGIMPEFTVGRFDADFENAAFALGKDSAISKPVLMADGYHIIQRLSRQNKPEEELALIKQQLQSDSRKELTKKILIQRTLKQAGFKMNTVNEKHLFDYADAVVNKRSSAKFTDVSDKTLLFTLGTQKVTVGDWMSYLQATKIASQNAKPKSYPELLEQYKDAVATEYYRNHLESYNPEFARQLQEFKEGNLLFEVMQRNIWDKAATDTVGMRKYYQGTKNKYWWEPSAEAVLFTCSNATIAAEIKSKIEKNPKSWRTLITAYDATVQTDSGRYEITQLPVKDAANVKVGTISEPLVNTADNSASVVYVAQIYPERSPRNFEDARGFVLNDYQNWLEEKWIESLKKKYPVKVNEAVLQSLWKK